MAVAFIYEVVSLNSAQDYSGQEFCVFFNTFWFIHENVRKNLKHPLLLPPMSLLFYHLCSSYCIPFDATQAHQLTQHCLWNKQLSEIYVHDVHDHISIQ
jgi:hypothetical protein